MLFRGRSGAPAALLDRCPHRNVPLSLGRVDDGRLECAYHGWRFDGDGACCAVPGLVGEPPARAAAACFAAMEQDGLVWVLSSPDEPPSDVPFRLPLLDARGYARVRRELHLRATLHAAAENALDVPHTAFLHGGWFRTAKQRNELEVVVRRGADRVEAEYRGEPRPKGLVGAILAPGGGTVHHVDRFILPSVVQVEYRLGERLHFLATGVLTPIDDFETGLFASVAFRGPAPGLLLRPAVTRIAMRIFRQDAAMLAAQTDAIRRFGGERFAHTEIDLLGPHIAHLLRRAAKGEPGRPLPPATRSLRM